MDEKIVYVKQLNKRKQRKIFFELHNALRHEYKGVKLMKAIEDGMNSRLVDLESVIDISLYVG